ncbi:MAG: DUF481 domain-containing protein [Proteobacteria bacterium]|nr:DUF481 domain-containing protein [Pseudomonadota bacterium]
MILKNGDRLTGKVRKKTRDTLRFKTPYAGLMEIVWDQVLSLHTDKPVSVSLDDGTEYLATEILIKENSIDMKSADGIPNTFSEAEVFTVKRTKKQRFNQFFGRASLGLKTSRGNTNTDNFDLDYQATYLSRTNRFRSYGQWEIDNVNVNADNERYKKRKWSLRNAFDFHLNAFEPSLGKKQFVSMRLNLEQDKLTDLDLRTQIGPFYGYQFAQSERYNLLLEGGLLWTDEDFILGPDKSYVAPAWHIRFDHYLKGRNFQIYHNQDGSFETGFDRVFLDTQTGFRMPIVKGFLVSLELDFEYDSDPAPTVESTDQTYRFKLGYRW